MVATIINWWTKIIICYVVATIINWWTENNKFIYGCSQFSFLIFFLSLFSQIFICIEVFVFVCNCSLFSKQCHKAVSSWAKSQSHLGYNLSRGIYTANYIKAPIYQEVWRYIAKCKALDIKFVKTFLHKYFFMDTY